MPKNGDLLSILGFGCMRLPLKNGRIDEERAIRQIRHAIDNGVNYVDTAWPYHGGKSEPLLRKALQDGYREKVRIATKLPSWMINSAADMDRFLDAQLERLGTAHIDYYLTHALDGPLWDKIEGLGIRNFLDKAKADGRIGNAGFSFHGLLPDFKRIVDAYPWVFCQIQYNYFDQDFQAGREGLQYAADRGLGIVVMEPLRGGVLSLPRPPAAIEKIWNEAETRRSPAEWALRWIWNHPDVTSILSGMNEESHIEENLAIAHSALPDSLTSEELDRVKRVGRKYHELMQVDCTGCGYCMPCPSGVQIPKCFDIYNKMKMFGNVKEAEFRYTFSVGGLLSDNKPGFASQCTACGECLSKCPQNIAINEVLDRVASEMEGPDLENRLAAARQAFRGEAG